MLSDESREARKAYNATRKMMGIGEARITFFIDSSGVVRYVLRFRIPASSVLIRTFAV